MFCGQGFAEFDFSLMNEQRTESGAIMIWCVGRKLSGAIGTIGCGVRLARIRSTVGMVRPRFLGGALGRGV